MGVFQWILWNLSQQFLIEHMRTVSVKNHFSAENNLTKQKRLHKNVKLTRKYLLNCNMVSLEQVFFPKTLKPISCQCFSVPISQKFPYSAFFWSVYFRIWVECGDLRSKSPYSVQMRKNTYQKNSKYEHILRSVLNVFFSCFFFQNFRAIIPKYLTILK